MTQLVDRAEISSRYLFVRLTGAEGETFETPVLVYVPNTGGDFTSPGDKMSFTARFRLPEDANSEKNGESTFDRTAWLKSRGVYGELYDVTLAETVSSAEQTFHAKFCDTLFSGARKAWETQQNKAYYDDIAALAQGLLYGDKGDFSKIEKQNFASSRPYAHFVRIGTTFYVSDRRLRVVSQKVSPQPQGMACRHVRFIGNLFIRLRLYAVGHACGVYGVCGIIRTCARRQKVYGKSDLCGGAYLLA